MGRQNLAFSLLQDNQCLGVQFSFQLAKGRRIFCSYDFCLSARSDTRLFSTMQTLSTPASLRARPARAASSRPLVVASAAQPGKAAVAGALAVVLAGTPLLAASPAFAVRIPDSAQLTAALGSPAGLLSGSGRRARR